MYKEALNKSRHAYYLHIFRLKYIKYSCVTFVQSWGGFRLRKICLRNLHTRFNQHSIITREMK